MRLPLSISAAALLQCFAPLLAFGTSACDAKRAGRSASGEQPLTSASSNVPTAPSPAPSHSAAEHGAAEHGAAEHGAAEHGAAEDSAVKHCDRTLDGRVLGHVDSTELKELSGLVLSRQHPNRLYAHNDSGDTARFFALDLSGKLRGRFELLKAEAVDWEDVAIGPASASGRDFLYFSDTGDNAARGNGRTRSQVAVYQVPEPERIEAEQPQPLRRWQRLLFTYPDRPHDCEALAVDPSNGDLYFATKENDGNSHIFLARAPHTADARVLESVTTIAFAEADSFGGAHLVTAMEIHPTLNAVAMRSYSRALMWRREGSETWGATFQRPARELPLRLERQGESLAFAPDSLSYYTVSEGKRPALWFFEHQACGR